MYLPKDSKDIFNDSKDLIKDSKVKGGFPSVHYFIPLLSKSW